MGLSEPAVVSGQAELLASVLLSRSFGIPALAVASQQTERVSPALDLWLY